MSYDDDDYTSDPPETSSSTGSGEPEQTTAVQVEDQPAEGITYIDLGDRTLEIDDRGPVQQRRVYPKSLRGFGVSAAVRRELEQRIETEVKAPARLAQEEADTDPIDRLPPVEDDDARENRERRARELEDQADERRVQGHEDSQREVAE